MSGSDPKHTNVGCSILSWPPYLALFRDHPLALHLWWTLYIGPKAKTLVPGLWMGGRMAMADEARLTLGEADAAIATLTEHELIEHDPRHGVTRLMKLPDRCERAQNPKMLRGWWDRREQVVPACGVRDRHLELMAWLHLPFSPKRGSKGRQGLEDANENQRAWDETWGPALALLRGGSVSTGGHGGSGSVPSGASPLQLDLYSGPAQRNGIANGSPNRTVPDQDQVPDQAEGEREREGLLVPMAAAGLIVSAPELEALGQAVILELGGPDAAKLWDAKLESAGPNRLHLRAPAWVARTYAGEIERQMRHRTGLPIQIAAA